jgi:hypothetical protein
MDASALIAQQRITVIRLFSVADLHHALKQLGWLGAHAAEFDPARIRRRSGAGSISDGG